MTDAANKEDGQGSALMSSNYDTDLLTWSSDQVKLLERMRAGELVNDQVDWENVIEEIASVGQSQVDAVESLLFQAFVHDLKANGWPDARDAPSWRGEARGFRAQALRKYRSSMRQKIDLAGIYADALEALPDTLDGQKPRQVQMTCPAGSVEELFGKPATEGKAQGNG